MSSFLYRLGQRCARHPFRVIGVWLLIALAVLGLNHQLGGSPKDNFTVPGVEAQRANDLLKDRFPEFSGAQGQIVFHVDDGSVTDPQNAEPIGLALDQLRDGTDVTAVSDPFDARGPTISADGRTAFVSVNYSIDPLESEHAEEAEAAAETARELGVEAELTGTWSMPRSTAASTLPGRTDNEPRSSTASTPGGCSTPPISPTNTSPSSRATDRSAQWSPPPSSAAPTSTSDDGRRVRADLTPQPPGLCHRCRRSTPMSVTQTAAVD